MSQPEEVHTGIFSGVARVVTLVVEGGQQTLENIYDDLRADTPVIIVDVSDVTHSTAAYSFSCFLQGNGRFATFFKRWLLYTKDFDTRIEAHQEPIDITHKTEQDSSVVPDAEAT